MYPCMIELIIISVELTSTSMIFETEGILFNLKNSRQAWKILPSALIAHVALNCSQYERAF